MPYSAARFDSDTTPASAAANSAALTALDVIGLNVVGATEPRESHDERRSHPRLAVEDLWWLDAVRVKYGAAVSIVDLSVGGVQLETEFRLQPGSTLVLELFSVEGIKITPVRVIRCQIARLDGGLRYRAACEFRQPLDLPELLPATFTTERRQPSSVRLDLALKKLVIAQLSRRSTTGRAKSASGAVAQILTVLQRLQTTAARQSDRAFDAEVRDLLADTIDLAQDEGSVAEVEAAFVRSLQAHLPGLSVGIVRAPSASSDQRAESIRFALERVDSSPSRYLNVRIPAGYQLGDAQFRLMKAGASLLTLLQIYRAASPKPASERRGSSPRYAKASGQVRQTAPRPGEGKDVDPAAAVPDPRRLKALAWLLGESPSAPQHAAR